MKIGQRVGAFLTSEEQENMIYLFGFGEYIGEGEFEVSEVSNNKFIQHINPFNGMLCPKIKLDNGSIIYGNECIFGDEIKIKQFLKNKQVKKIDVDLFRQRYYMSLLN